jgi:hypothetical protein
MYNANLEEKIETAITCRHDFLLQPLPNVTFMRIGVLKIPVRGKGKTGIREINEYHCGSCGMFIKSKEKKAAFNAS